MDKKIIALTGADGFVGQILKKELEAVGHVVIPARTDKDIMPKIPKLDCLIHAARHHGYISGGSVDEINMSVDKWVGEYMTDVVLPQIFTCKMVEKYPMLNNVIFISSIYGRRVPTVRPIPRNYQCAKAAEIQLSKSLAVELAPKIRVNRLILGGILSDRAAAEQYPEFREKYGAKTLLNRMVLPDELGGAIRYLVSDESKGMTGAEIVIDGGYTV